MAHGHAYDDLNTDVQAPWQRQLVAQRPAARAFPAPSGLRKACTSRPWRLASWRFVQIQYHRDITGLNCGIYASVVLGMCECALMRSPAFDNRHLAGAGIDAVDSSAATLMDASARSLLAACQSAGTAVAAFSTCWTLQRLPLPGGTQRNTTVNQQWRG